MTPAQIGAYGIGIGVGAAMTTSGIASVEAFAFGLAVVGVAMLMEALR